LALALLLISLLSASQVPVVNGLDDSTMLVVVEDSRFHVEIEILIQLSVDDYSQFVDAEDAYSREAGAFRRKLEKSIGEGVQELTGVATVTSLEIETIECIESAGKMRVELSFDVEGAITTERDGGKVYDLRWRSFEADSKFTCALRNIKPSEALGLDFSGFSHDLDDEDEWRVEESGGNTVIRKKQEYVIEVDAGKVDLRLTQKFTLPGTGLIIGEDTVKSEASAETTNETAAEGAPWWKPLIDFFMWLRSLLFGWL